MRLFSGLLLSFSLLLPLQQAPAKRAAEANGQSMGTGHASYYGNKFIGQRTASGEPYSAGAFTAAHRTARFGSRIRVTHLGNGREVTVRVNDRGPFVRGRIIDLSHAAARKIGLHHSGTARVRLTMVSP